ncbi:MAG: FecR domain-containing protein [Pseudolabrys sp.]|nr:FecR domain-containing protein [Pseudolabrys sp.]
MRKTFIVLVATIGMALALSAPGFAQSPGVAPGPIPAAPAPAQDQTQAADEIGNVASVQGSATVTRNGAAAPLKVQDPIYKGDLLRTGPDGALGITFDDETTFNLSANASIAVNDFVYSEGGSGNAALFNVARGTVAFAAHLVAKTGDMKISTPSSTLGIRGTTGVIDVPDGATPGSTGEVAVKLYADADGRVGRIELFDRGGARLGFLNRAATGFALRGGTGGRFAAVPLTISPQQAARDRGFVQRTFAARNVGRQMVIQRRILRGPAPNLQRGPAAPGVRQPGAPNVRPQQPGVQQPGLRQPPNNRQPGLRNAPPQRGDLRNQPRPRQQQQQKRRGPNDRERERR